MFTFMSFILLDLLAQGKSGFPGPLLVLDCSSGHFRLFTHSAPSTAQHSSSCVFYMYLSDKTGRNLCLGCAEVHNCQAQMATNFCTYTATCWASYNAKLFSVWPTTLKSMSPCPPILTFGNNYRLHSHLSIQLLNPSFYLVVQHAKAV